MAAHQLNFGGVPRGPTPPMSQAARRPPTPIAAGRPRRMTAGEPDPAPPGQRLRACPPIPRARTKIPPGVIANATAPWVSPMSTHDPPNPSDRTAWPPATDDGCSHSETCSPPTRTARLRTALPGLELRTINIEQIASTIRRSIDLSADGIAPGLAVAMHRRSHGPLIQFEEVDADGWLAWVIAGVYLFSGGLPSMDEVRLEAKRTAMCLAMFRGRGKLSRAAAALGTSRKVLRANLKVTGLYPWVGRQERSPRWPANLERYLASKSRPNVTRGTRSSPSLESTCESKSRASASSASGSQTAGDGDVPTESRDNTRTSASTSSRDGSSSPASHTWTDPA